MDSLQTSFARLRSAGKGRLERVALFAVCLLVAGSVSVVSFTNNVASAAGSPCGVTVNPIACENQQPGTPESVWDVDGAGDVE